MFYNSCKYTHDHTTGASRNMTVLCVDDHPVLLNGLEQNVRLAAPGADIHSFTTSKDALSYAEGLCVRGAPEQTNGDPIKKSEDKER